MEFVTRIGRWRWTAFFLQFVLFNSLTEVGLVNAAPAPEASTICNPIPSPTSVDNVYIIGYGSLLNSASKNKTDPNTGVNIPVIISGYARHWNCLGPPIDLGTTGTTFLGVEKIAGKQFNGVVFKVNTVEGLIGFDNRELSYCREEVLFQEIKFLITFGNNSTSINLPDPTDKFYIYVVKPTFRAWPTRRYPIVQSYVDIFLSGCLEMQKTYGLESYADDCMNNTEGWDNSWVDDRITPREPWTNQSMVTAIDSLISKYLPSHFQNVLVK